MGMWKSMAGELKIEIISASQFDLLSELNQCNIRLFDIRYVDELTVVFIINLKDFTQFKRIVSRRGEKWRILQRNGAFLNLSRLRKRPVLIFAAVVYIMLLIYIPNRVLFIQVQGNTVVTDERIVDQANKCGIFFGASRRDVRSEKMKNILLEAIPELQWAGVNTYGCVAVISVKERTAEEGAEQQEGVASIVAKCDGVIREITVLQGNPLCRVGQAVKTGELLVSGYTDCGSIIKAQLAKAEIIAQTRHELTSVTPGVYTERTDFSSKGNNYYIIFGKKLINLWKDSGISSTTCVKMYEEYNLTLPGGFVLPVSLVKEQLLDYKCDTLQIPQDVAEDILHKQTQDHLLRQMLAGKISEAFFETQSVNDVYYQYGDYACLEMIGQVRSEEIISGDGKRS